MKQNFKRVGLILAILLILAIPIAVIGGVIYEKNHSAKTMSIEEARALATKICMASTGVNDATRLVPASIEEYNYDEVQLCDVGDTFWQFLFMGKCALDQGEKKEGYLSSKWHTGGVISSQTVYIAYKLQKKSVVFDIVGLLEDGSPYLRYAMEFCNYENDNWGYEVYDLDIKNEIENYDNTIDHFGKQKSCMLVSVTGSGMSIKKIDIYILDTTKSIYSDALTNVDVNNLEYYSWDAVDHKKTDKTKIDFTNQEINQISGKIQSNMKDAWSPKFYEIQCKETFIIDTVMEILDPIHQEYMDYINSLN